MDPQQELFTKLLTEIKALGYDVYDAFCHQMVRRILLCILQTVNRLMKQIRPLSLAVSIRQSIFGVIIQNAEVRYQKCCWRLKIHAENWNTPIILHGMSGT